MATTSAGVSELFTGGKPLKPTKENHMAYKMKPKKKKKGYSKPKKK